MQIVFLDRDSVPANFPDLGSLAPCLEYASTAPSELIARCNTADIVITGEVALTSAAMLKMPNLKMVAVPGPSLDHVDLAHCKEAGIDVRSCDGYAEVSVAEHALALMMCLGRNLLSLNRCGHLPSGARVQDLRGKLLGVVGTGVMGRATARLAKSMGLRVVHSERKHAVTVRDGYMRFQQVLALCDIVSLHCPLTLDTAGMLGRPEFSAMKRGALLINTAHGGLIQEAPLVQALREGSLGGAGLDCMPQELEGWTRPLGSPDPLNLIVTPRVAHLSNTSRERLGAMLVEHIHSYLRANDGSRAQVK